MSKFRWSTIPKNKDLIGDQELLKSNLQSHLKTLTEDIGPRATGSPEEKCAAEYAQSVLESIGGLRSSIQSFAAPADIDRILAVLYGFYSIAGFLVLVNPLLGWMMVLVVIFLLFRETTYRPLISNLFPHQSHNVVGQFGSGESLKTEIVLIAHLDSGRVTKGSSNPSPQVERYSSIILVFFLINGLIFLSLVTILSIFGYGTELRKLAFVLALPSLIYAGVLSIVLFAGRKFHAHGVGANDNASGVAVVLETARTLSQEMSNKCRIVFLLTGSEESGLRGILNFLASSHDDDSSRVFINVDSCGSGKLSLIAAEGWLRLYPSSLLLQRIARMCAEDKGISLEESRKSGAYVSDLTPVLRSRCLGLTISALKEGGRIPLVHREDDRLENISIDPLVDAVILLSCMAVRISVSNTLSDSLIL